MSQRPNTRALVEKSLPPLKETCGDFQGFAAGEKCGQRVHEMLLKVIQRYRGKELKRFYTIREVAKFFGVAHGTVETVFRRLGHEGALTVVRSSQTMIPLRVSRPRFAIRGVVCMPIWLPGFLQFLDWRRGFSQLEEELSRYRFILEPVFYRQDEDKPDFADRILKFNPDYLLWSYPARHNGQIMQMIEDTGVSVLVIQNSGETFPYTGRIYWQSYRQGFQKGLQEWEASGEIDELIIPQYPAFVPRHGAFIPSASKVLNSTLKTCRLPHRIKTFPARKFSLEDFSAQQNFMRRLAPNARAGIIFDDDLLYTRLCARMPDAMLKLFQSRRVMVMREATLPSFAQLPAEVTADALLLPWKQLARRIAMDLNKGQSHVSKEKIIFEAKWRPRTPLENIVQTDINA